MAERSDIVSDPLDLIIINSTSTNIYDTLTIVENSSENKAIDVDVDSLYTFSKKFQGEEACYLWKTKNPQGRNNGITSNNSFS